MTPARLAEIRQMLRDETPHYKWDYAAIDDLLAHVEELELALRSIDAATDLATARRRANKAMRYTGRWEDLDPDPSPPKPLTPLENWQQNDEHNVR